ncbi:hypothetical protein D3C85_1416670 [compost metagenome]
MDSANVTLIVLLVPTVIVCVTNPTNENVILSFELTSFKMYLPSKSVDALFFEPCTLILAPGKGTPEGSTTTPCMVFDCAITF